MKPTKGIKAYKRQKKEKEKKRESYSNQLSEWPCVESSGRQNFYGEENRDLILVK